METKTLRYIAVLLLLASFIVVGNGIFGWSNAGTGAPSFIMAYVLVLGGWAFREMIWVAKKSTDIAKELGTKLKMSYVCARYRAANKIRNEKEEDA
jgi:hypothetical protein